MEEADLKFLREQLRACGGDLAQLLGLLGGILIPAAGPVPPELVRCLRGLRDQTVFEALFDAGALEFRELALEAFYEEIGTTPMRTDKEHVCQPFTLFAFMAHLGVSTPAEKRRVLCSFSSVEGLLQEVLDLNAQHQGKLKPAAIVHSLRGFAITSAEARVFFSGRLEEALLSKILPRLA